MRYSKMVVFFLFLFFPISVFGDQANLKEVEVEILNKNLTSYLQKQVYFEHIKGICSYDFCMSFNPYDLVSSLRKFETKYLSYVLQKSGEDAYHEVSLKGFPITKILLS